MDENQIPIDGLENQDANELFLSFDDTMEGEEQENFLENNPLKKHQTTGKKKRRSSFGVAAAALNTKKKKRMSDQKHSVLTTLKTKVVINNEILESKSSCLSTNSSSTSSSKLSTKSLTLTKPVAPILRLEQRLLNKASRQSNVTKSEDLLLEKIQKEKKEEQDKIEKARRHYQILKSKGFKDTTKSVPLPHKRITIPKAPCSILDQRYGAKVPSSLKKDNISVPKKSRSDSIASLHPTIPQPFQFATDKRLHYNSTDAKTLTAGEIAEKFMRDPRSHHVPDIALTKVTTPHSPKLRTEIRSKSTKRDVPLSREELEQKCAEEQSKFVFKARVLDRRIFESRGEFGVPKVAVKPPTIPLDMELRTERRAASPRARPSQATEDFQTPVFKARPLPSTIKLAEKIRTPPSKVNFKPTIAVSPKLHGSTHASAAPTRRQKSHHAEVEKEKKMAEKSRKSFSLKVTQPQEFNFQTAARSEIHRAQLEEQLVKQKQTEDKVSIKANPVPDFTKVFQPKVHNKEPTIPEPFSLMSIQLHEESLLEFQKEVEEERRRELEASCVKAKGVPKSLYEPVFQAKFEETKVTIPIGMKLESDERAKKRYEFDEEISKKLTAIESMQLEMEKQKEDQENRLLKELRRKSVEEGGLQFKAKPILKEDPFPVKSCSKAFEPTIPKSPKFVLKERRAPGNENSHVEDSMKGKFAAALRNL